MNPETITITERSMYDAIVEFPKMKVAVRTREERVSEIRYLPPNVAVQAPRNALAERAARQALQMASARRTSRPWSVRASPEGVRSLIRRDRP